MRLLVAGGDRVDAGKTTFAVGLLSHLADHSADPPAAFKPRAGNDYWFDHDDVRRAASEGRLYGKDVDRLVAAAGGGTEPEARNPIHRLWRPTPGRTGMLGEAGRTFLLDRVTTGDSDAWVVNANADPPASVRDALPLSDARAVESVTEFNDAMRDLHLPALERLAAEVRATAAPHAVVESYGDVADPFADVAYDAVGVVDPGRVRVYDGARWAVATEAVSGSPDRGRLEERVPAVSGMLDRVAARTLPALASEERTDPTAVADANREAYETLCRVARDD